MNTTETTSNLYWYECDMLPLVGFIRAGDEAQAKEAALDAMLDRLREYLTHNANLKLERIEV
ncbi:MAG TPA: hypothetical protein VNC18_17600 [Gemmatimonadaceae bacterium]|jgi:hypothetical protein|nr:hypothetical protein [Gemmatimonadaceae bacterium]